MTEIKFKNESLQGEACLVETPDWTEFGLVIMTCDRALVEKIEKWMESVKE